MGDIMKLGMNVQKYEKHIGTSLWNKAIDEDNKTNYGRVFSNLKDSTHAFMNKIWTGITTGKLITNKKVYAKIEKKISHLDDILGNINHDLTAHEKADIKKAIAEIKAVCKLLKKTRSDIRNKRKDNSFSKFYGRFSKQFGQRFY